jgi:probable biosynthetic protein (TIGR04098 family)
MSKLSKFIRNQRVKRFRRGIAREHSLRRYLAEYVLKYGFEIGDFSGGWPDVRPAEGAKLKVGKFSSIARGATFVLGGEHAVNSMTTYLLDLVFDKDPERMLTTRGDIVVGSDVWIASNALILSGVTIGDGAVVGLGAVVLDDVAPYSIVLGNPARTVAKRFSDDVIAELLELRWWDLDLQQIKSLQMRLEDTDAAAFLRACRQCRGLPAERAKEPAPGTEGLTHDATRRVAKLHDLPRSGSVQSGANALAAPKHAPGDLDGHVIGTIRRQCPGFSAKDMDTSFDRLGIDSIGMVMIRTELENAANTALEHHQWDNIVTPADLATALRTAKGISFVRDVGTATSRRVYELNMPQMALGGLSESWLFKELGDMHWSTLAKELGSPSHLLRDSSGERIYATFTRFQFESTSPLAQYRENERVELDASMSRYGAGLFFSESEARGNSSSIRASLMSTFSKFGEDASNTSLLKGLPEVPADCNIPELAVLPDFAAAYRTRRTRVLPPAIFECEYEIIPSHDINGVGLLYFAAYPIINDICATKHAGRALMMSLSTVRRDVFYFGNSNLDDTLIYRLHEWNAGEQTIDMLGSLSRKSDGNVIAHILTRKALLEPRDSGKKAIALVAAES